MAENKTRPTDADVGDFVAGLSARRRDEAERLIEVMTEISGEPPVLWEPSIIGFGKVHYRYESGRTGEMPASSFSPRKASLTIYLPEGFDRYADLLDRLGKHRTSVSCLYLNNLDDANPGTLRELLTRSWWHHQKPERKPTTVAEYVATIPEAARPHFDELRVLAREALPEAGEELGYGILGYRMPDSKGRAYISGWRDHVAIYPIPRDEELAAELAPFQQGKGTLWFALTEPLPAELIRRTLRALLGGGVG
ncbi:uncharacterized protein YdhG (YjbR/CyaY superfamily) [Propionibacteriaceae bacterium ES.041]|uniref:DUF1801 domain-containing protein n=1 Tax=Enemella evansiae TaxID=2016499 RepID=UPI000C0058E0|nr:DUF1801 domain-containing protein [Enemella evansiae]PFG68141.1 uncharacterized protein YdhG (YjbR/CyaY superfamily) [Propionibacteriaceae bacterium ES.041]